MSYDVFDVPILLMVFNRYKETSVVVNALREIKPKMLFIASDAPRDKCANDEDKVSKVRSIFDNIGWECEIHKLYQERNQGCRFGPEKGITWFFNNVKEGIILEDDCCPHNDFFSFCKWGLNKYRDEKRVWHINGNNFDAPRSLYAGKSYAFTSLPQVWGWATWSDRWKHYQGNPYYIKRDILEKSIHEKWLITKRAKAIKYNHLNKLLRGLDAWDYQWQMTVLNNEGLVLSSSSNLISNLGDGDDATHTKKDQRVRLKTYSYKHSDEEIKVEKNKSLTNWYEKNMGLKSIKKYMNAVLLTWLSIYGKFLKDLLSSILYGQIKKPIVIASTGRSGSTMLYESVVNSYIKSRYGKLCANKVLYKYLKKAAGGYADRVKDLIKIKQPIIKTHSLFREEYIDSAKYIFVFGDPFESAKSVENIVTNKDKVWFEEHVYHLESSGYIEDIYKSDVLNYNEQIESWASKKRSSILVLSYDDIWKNMDDVSKHIGFSVEIPKKKTRKKKKNVEIYNEELFSCLSAHANDLYQKIKK